MQKPLLIGLDRDGTINLDDGHFGRKDNWKEVFGFQNYAVEGIKELRRLAGNEGKIFVATNQPGVANGYFSCDRVREINGYMDALLKNEGIKIDNWQFCPYVTSEHAKRKGLALDNPWISDGDLRKPGAGMVRKACEEMKIRLEDYDLYFIGDRKGDVLTGINAGGIGCLVLTGVGLENKSDVMGMYLQYPWRVQIGDNLLDIAQQLEARREAQ